ncbi:hypothetical protein BDV19DRAFT_48523 [Aspergillus venezuelensis]
MTLKNKDYPDSEEHDLNNPAIDGLDRLPQDNRAETNIILPRASQQVNSTESNPRTDGSSREDCNRSRTPAPNTNALPHPPTDHGSQIGQPAKRILKPEIMDSLNSRVVKRIPLAR